MKQKSSPTRVIRRRGFPCPLGEKVDFVPPPARHSSCSNKRQRFFLFFFFLSSSFLFLPPSSVIPFSTSPYDIVSCPFLDWIFYFIYFSLLLCSVPRKCAGCSVLVSERAPIFMCQVFLRKNRMSWASILYLNHLQYVHFEASTHDFFVFRRDWVTRGFTEQVPMFEHHNLEPKVAWR